MGIIQYQYIKKEFWILIKRSNSKIISLNELEQKKSTVKIIGIFTEIIDTANY